MPIDTMMSLLSTAPIIQIEQHGDAPNNCQDVKPRIPRPTLPRLQSDEMNARIMSATIVQEACSEARTKRRQSVLLGRCDEGNEALENGLNVLKALETEDDGASDYWTLAKAEIKIEQGKKGEARDLLAHCNCHPQLQGTRTNLLKRKKTDSPRDTDDQYKEMIRFSSPDFNLKLQDQLDVWLRADGWTQATSVACELYDIDPEYFDIKTKMDRFAKCRQLLNLGLLRELEEKEKGGSDLTRDCMAEALRVYNHGCFVTELFYKHLDDPKDIISGHDHVDCANLFFSAARVCIYFDRNGIFDEHGAQLMPKAFTKRFEKSRVRCSPALKQADWRHQALWFIEQGRSRALLKSIIRGEQEIVPRLPRLRLAYVVDAVTARMRRDRSLSEYSSTNSRTGSNSSDRSAAGHSLSEVFKPVAIPTLGPVQYRQSQNGLPLRPIITSVGPASSPFFDTPSGSPLSVTPTNGLKTDEEVEHERRRLVRLKWKKWSKHVLLYWLANDNPTLGAALQVRDHKWNINQMRKSIPPRTAVIEYSFVSTTPTGLMFLVITNAGIQEALWVDSDVKSIQKQILELRHSMWTSTAKPRDSFVERPTSEQVELKISVERLRKTLHASLVAPIEKHLTGMSRLIIVPSGDLAHVPWTMFFDVALTVVPSLSIWDRLHASATESAKVPFKISVVSNSPHDENGLLRDIPYSRIEAYYVAKIHKQLPFLADENDRPSFQKQAESTHILHLCAHSSFNDKDPMCSSIQLFKEPLTIRGWHELTIRPELVIFSSCLSGISKAFDSGSTFGFAHTLLATGTRAFIGSLWPVDDAATLILMMLFYKELKNLLSPSEALYKAQQKMRYMKEDELFELTMELEAMFPPGKNEHSAYVFPAKYNLDVLKTLSVEGLREPRCWAAFALTGYGCKPIYSVGP